MKRRTAPKTNIAFSLAMIALVLVMATSYMTSGLYARYVSSASGSDSARVARFDIQETGTLYTETFAVELDPSTGALNPAALEIKNSSEVAVRCVFTYETTGNLPLDIYWKNGTTKVEEFVFGPNTTTAQRFDLCVEWSDEAMDDTYLYHREIDSITVTITCVQID